MQAELMIVGADLSALEKDGRTQGRNVHLRLVPAGNHLSLEAEMHGIQKTHMDVYTLVSVPQDDAWKWRLGRKVRVTFELLEDE